MIVLHTVKKNYLFVCIMLVVIIGMNLFTPGVSAENESEDFFEIIGEHFSGEGYFTMKDMDTQEIIMKRPRIHVGDEYINQENNYYRVEKLEADIAWARFIGKIQLSNYPAEDVLKEYQGANLFIEGQAQNNGTLIGVYHSHGAEAYVPSDGSESISEGGGILQVGDSFAAALEEKGLNVIHSTETHVPHDAGAYNRSRRTAEELLRDGTSVLFDVHRDAVPQEEYTETVNNQETVQIQFVVGRQNQNMETIRQFAESLKQTTDNIYPGLIKGIFFARGNYNQDMTPLTMLLEVGAHENTREGAENSVALFADAVNSYFVGPQGEQAREGIGMTALRTILWIILIALLALGAYLLISTGNLEEARAKLTHFFRKEFAEFGRKRKNGEDGGSE
ncbi:MAG: stage II sporulation protein P [Bacillota bacterium]|nr:stage II sporulation protein P [Bacillota bacterium]